MKYIFKNSLKNKIQQLMYKHAKRDLIIFKIKIIEPNFQNVVAEVMKLENELIYFVNKFLIFHLFYTITKNCNKIKKKKQDQAEFKKLSKEFDEKCERLFKSK